MKKVSKEIIEKYTYDSREERDKHVEIMESKGWSECGRIKRLKAGVSILNATKDDYEYFAEFYKGVGY